MNKREFKKVMEVLDAQKVGTLHVGEDHQELDFYRIGGLQLFFDEYEKAYVIGNFSSKFLRDYSKKYVGYDYYSREIDKAKVDSKSSEDSLCLRLAKGGLSKDEYWAISDKNYAASKKRKYRCDANLWFEQKEMLIKFIAEYEDYLLRTHNLPESEVAKIDGLITEANLSIFGSYGYPITIDEWVKGDFNVSDDFKSIIERSTETLEMQDFKTALIEFDKAVNPLLNEDYTPIEVISNYSNRNVYLTRKVDPKFGITFKSSIHLPKHGKFNTGTDCASCERDSDGFRFSVNGSVEDKLNLYVSHEFGEDEEEDCERLVIDSYDNSDGSLCIIYNIGKGTVKFNNGPEVPMTPILLTVIMERLKMGTELASSITSSNLKNTMKEKK